MTKPKENGRQSDGTFAPGNKLGGRTRGSRNKTTIAVEEILEGEHEKLTRKAIDLALQGDPTAMRLCLDRIAPARKDSPVSFALPPIKTVEDAVTASASLLTAVAEGDVTPDEAGRVMALLTSHKNLSSKRAIWKPRIAALEAKK